MGLFGGRTISLGVGKESTAFLRRESGAHVVHKERHPDKVLLEWEKHSNYVEAELALSKLMYKLFSKNFPDIYEIDIDGSKHQYIKSDKEAEASAHESIIARNRFLRLAGIKIDPFYENFVKSDREIVYLDRIKPWNVRIARNYATTIWPFFDSRKIKDLISYSDDEQSRKECEELLKVLEQLLDQEAGRLHATIVYR